MLGHRSIKTTQLYAKVTQKKISNNMKALQQTLQVLIDKQSTSGIATGIANSK